MQYKSIDWFLNDWGTMVVNGLKFDSCLRQDWYHFRKISSYFKTQSPQLNPEYGPPPERKISFTLKLYFQLLLLTIFRSIRSQMFFKIGVPEN